MNVDGNGFRMAVDRSWQFPISWLSDRDWLIRIVCGVSATVAGIVCALAGIAVMGHEFSISSVPAFLFWIGFGWTFLLIGKTLISGAPAEPAASELQAAHSVSTGIIPACSRVLAETLRRIGAAAMNERINTALFYGCTIALLIPLWGFKYLPSQDGPLHIYNAIVLRDYNAPDRQLFRDFFLPNPKIVPNWTCPHILPLLMRFLPAVQAEKLLLSGYLILLPLSVRYALRAIRKRASVLAIASLPFVPNQYYHMGFHDFCFSLIGFFFVTGYWLKHRRHFALPQAAWLALLLLVLYLTHLVSLVMVLPLIGLTALAMYWPGDQPLRLKLRRLLPVGLSMLPVLALAASFTLAPHSSQPADPYPRGWTHRFYLLFDWMKAYQYRDLLAAGAVFTLFAVTSAWLLGRRRRPALRWGLAGGLAATFVLYVIVFLLAPDAIAGGELLVVRLAAFPTFALLLWWGAQPISSSAFQRLQLFVTVVSIPALVWLLGSQASSYADLNGYLAEFDVIPAMLPAGATLLPVHYDYFQALAHTTADAPLRKLAIEIDPFRHAEARGLAERGIIDVANHWATTDHHSVVWQPGFDPMTVGLDMVDNFTGYARRIGRPIDFVLFWSGGVAHDDLQGRLINSQLRDGYELIYTSPNTGYLQLYRRISEPRYAMR